MNLRPLRRAALLAMLLSGNVYAYSVAPYRVYPVPSWPDVVTVGDFNGDGRKDVVLATIFQPFNSVPDDHTLFVFLQADDGSLNAPIKVVYSSPEEEGNDSAGYRTFTGIAAADLNRDGIDDIVVGRRQGLTTVLGNRDGAFAAKRIQCTTGACSGDAIVVLDVDNDQKPDIATHNDTSGDSRWGITVYFGDAAGEFSRQRFVDTRSDGGIVLKAADLNSDGRKDLAISWLQGLDDGVEIFPGDGAGWFGASIYIRQPAGLLSTYLLAVGDFNGDHRDDCVIGGPSTAFDGGRFFYYRQDAVGGLLAPTILPAAAPVDTADNPDKAVTADLNLDGKDDLVIVRSSGLIGYFEHGAVELDREVPVVGPYATWSNPHGHGLAVGDIDNDGCNDIVTANYNYGLVVFRGQGCFGTDALFADNFEANSGR